MASPQLRMVGVTKRYGAHTAVDALSLDVAAGETVVILGPSGCGKTTLLRLAAGLETPDDGEIWVDGRLVAKAGRSLIPPRERQIGFVFQDLALWPHMSVARHLTFVMASAGIPKSAWTARVAQALQLFHIDAMASRYPHELSGGEQQRVGLARAMVAQPRLLLLDEPFSSLDFALHQSLRTELTDLQRRLALTTIYVTHDREDAHAVADRTVCMIAGRVTSISERSASTSGRRVSDELTSSPNQRG